MMENAAQQRRMPAFAESNLSESQITLVMTEVESQKVWLSDKVSRGCSHRAGGILQRSLNSKQDVLLPKIDLPDAKELFVIAAVTGEVGGEAITKRIGEKLLVFEEILQSDLIFSTSYLTLPLMQRRAEESRESFVEKVAAKIQESIDEQCIARMVKA